MIKMVTRTFFLLFVLISACGIDALAQVDLVITEIMYNPPEKDSDSLEFVEIYNNGTAPVNLKDFKFTDGIKDTLPDFLLAPNAFYVVADDSLAIWRTFGIHVRQWADGGLKNGGENIQLSDPLGNIIDEVKYNDKVPWPEAPDGDGPSLELCDPSLDNAESVHWTASANYVGVNAAGDSIFATPGQSCSSIGWEEVRNSTYLEITPNPCDGHFYIKAKTEGEYGLMVYSQLGTLCYDHLFFGNAYEVNLKYLPRGMYCLVLFDKKNNQSYSKKLLIQ